MEQEIRGDGVGAHVSESIASFEGNTSGILVGFRLLFGVRLGRHFSYLNSTADYARLGGDTQMAKGFAYVRQDYEFTPFLWSEIFGQIEADRFRRIARRELLGAGPRLALLQNPCMALFVGTAYMLEFTRLSLDGPDPHPSSLAHRSSNYVAFTWRLWQSAALSQSLYVQPRFDALEDIHFLSVTDLEFKLTARLSSRIDTTARYDTRQTPQTKQYDLVVKNMLDFRF
jgi:hypothetical protein